MHFSTARPRTYPANKMRLFQPSPCIPGSPLTKYYESRISDTGPSWLMHWFHGPSMIMQTFRFRPGKKEGDMPENKLVSAPRPQGTDNKITLQRLADEEILLLPKFFTYPTTMPWYKSLLVQLRWRSTPGARKVNRPRCV